MYSNHPLGLRTLSYTMSMQTRSQTGSSVHAHIYIRSEVVTSRFKVQMNYQTYLAACTNTPVVLSDKARSFLTSMQAASH